MKSKNTLLKKVIFLFISIFIPLTLLCVSALYSSNKKLTEQVLSSIASNNSSYLSQLDTSLGNVYINNFNLINQPRLQKLSNTLLELPIYEKSIQINLLREQMSASSTVSPFIESVHIYFKNSGTSYNSSGYQLGSFTNLSQKELQALEQMEQGPKTLHYFLNPLTNEWNLAFFLSPTISYDYGSVLILSQKELQDYLAANTAYENEFFLLTLDNGFSLTNFNSELLKKAASFQEQLSTDAANQTYQSITLEGSNYYVFFYEMSDIPATYMRFIPTQSILKHLNTMPIVITCFFLFVSTACILFFIGIYRLIHQPLAQLTTAFEEMEKGNFKAAITDYQNSDFAYLYQAFNNMTYKLENLIEKDYNQKLLLQKAELKQLQAQINPHFLYNSFFMLQRMIKMELIEESQEMANALGVYFRYLTRNSMDNVTLAEEYEHAKTYAYIQSLRFAGRIQINFEEILPRFEKLAVPKLILQPILENAFNYGLKNKMKDGILEVRCSATDDTLTIIVEENGEELTDELLNSLTAKLESVKTDSVDYEMTGLLNIQRRLIIFSNFSYALHVSHSQLGGLCVSLILNNNVTEVS